MRIREAGTQQLPHQHDRHYFAWNCGENKHGWLAARQVVNRTMLRLHVGEQVHLKRSLRTLATLGPDAEFCLPALRAENAQLCFQPAGACMLGLVGPW